MKMKKLFLPVVLLSLLVLYVGNNGLSASDSVSLPTEKYEIPQSRGARSEVILKRMGYTVSFNPQANIPHWVAWELNPERLIERESRSDKFLPDPNIDERRAVTTDDYKGSGWDRGHMCPAGDNRWHWKAMNESFYMTNICP
jgi:endonuclease G